MLLVIVVTPACRRPRPAAPARPNVLLITVDTLRADRLGCYGSRVPTPNLDRLAQEGALFEQAVCPMPQTRPSHATLLTARYPREHGVMSNGDPLPPGRLTLPEVLRQAGYQTGGFVSAALFRAPSGVQRGFDRFDCPQGKRQQRRAAAVISQVVSWVEGVPRDRPFFAWVHLFDPHVPYDPPAPYAPAGRDDVVAALPRLSRKNAMRVAARHHGDLPEPFYERAVALYNGEVAYTDYWVGVLLDALRADGRIDHTVVILTADHGECFEHGTFFEHTCLYEGTVRVPLIVRYPPRVAPGQRRGAIVEHLDVAPTVLSLVGLTIPSEFRGRSLFDAAVGASRNAFVEYPRYSDSRIGRSEKSARRMRTVRGEPVRPIPSGAAFVVRNADWKYIVFGPAEELYHLPTDPQETTNMASGQPEVLVTMRAALQEWLKRHPDPEPNQAVLTEEARETLRALGYAD